MQNLLPQPPATRLPEEPEAAAALADALAVVVGARDVGGDEEPPAAGTTAETAAVAALKSVAAGFPANSAAWAHLAEYALRAGDPVAGYAFARTGYHRGLDALRRSGWRGHGPVPWSHEPNRGFLRALAALARSADAIGEADEAARCAQFLRDCDPAAADALAG